MFSNRHFVLNNEFIHIKEGDKILYDTRWTYEEFLNGGTIVMEKELVIKSMREAI